MLEQCSPKLGYGKQSRAALQGRQEEMTLIDPNSPECAQPCCGAHCYLVPAGEPGSATRGGPERALRWGRHTDLGALCFVALVSETSEVVRSVQRGCQRSLQKQDSFKGFHLYFLLIRDEYPFCRCILPERLLLAVFSCVPAVHDSGSADTGG